MKLKHRFEKMGNRDQTITFFIGVSAIAYLLYGLFSLIGTYKPPQSETDAATLLGLGITMAMFAFYFVERVDLRKTK